MCTSGNVVNRSQPEAAGAHVDRVGGAAVSRGAAVVGVVRVRGGGDEVGAGSGQQQERGEGLQAVQARGGAVPEAPKDPQHVRRVSGEDDVVGGGGGPPVRQGDRVLEGEGGTMQRAPFGI